MTVGFIGAGNMGGALAGAVARAMEKNEDIAGDVLICDKNTERASALAESLGGRAVSAEEIIDCGDIIFFGIKPQGIPALADELSDSLAKLRNKRRRLPLAVTMAAGVSISEFECWFGGLPVIRIMPNTPVSVGEGVVFWCAADGVANDMRCAFLSIMSHSGELFEVDENRIDAAGALSGCGPAFVYMFIEALADGAVAAGLDRHTALRAATSTVIGAGTLLRELDCHPGELKDAVCSPGGTTIEGVRTLEEHAMRAAVMDAVWAAYAKTEKLKK